MVVEKFAGKLVFLDTAPLAAAARLTTPEPGKNVDLLINYTLCFI